MASLAARIAAPLIAIAVSASASAASDVRTLYEAMGLPDILEIMREEGIAYGEDLREEMFPGQGAAGWPRVVERIYAYERLEGEFLASFEAALDDTDVEPLVDFFSSDRGRQIVSFEISARRALLDDAIEEAAKVIWQDLQGEFDPRMDLIERFVEVNDLIEENVAGAMNSSLAFYEGLASGDAFDGAWTTDRILATVWDQEAEIRAETRDWIYPYLALAFEPLSGDDIEAYIALSESDAGRALNTALFSAFDVLFVDVSRDLGAAAATYLEGEDI